jgi:hypothetical protein
MGVMYVELPGYTEMSWHALFLHRIELPCKIKNSSVEPPVYPVQKSVPEVRKKSL